MFFLFVIVVIFSESTEITPEPCPSPVVVDEIVVDERSVSIIFIFKSLPEKK